MGRFGFIVGATLLLAGGASLIADFWLGAAPRAVLALQIAATAAGAVLFGAAAPRIARAFLRLAASSPPPPSGPLPVATAKIALPPLLQERAAATAQIWHPASGAQEPADLSRTAPVDAIAARLRRPPPTGRYPVLLYAPGSFGSGDDNASTSASLASHGYVVVAIDDVDRDQPLDPAQPPFFDFSSEAAYEATLRRGANKAALEAKHALDVLDRLHSCVDWPDHVQFDRVGFFGFSFGGAVAAMAGILDPRVAAVANLDGWVFGAALTGAIEKPYLLLVEDEIVPGPRVLNSSDPAKRYYAILQQRFLREHARLLETEDKYGFRFRDVAHDNFTDAAFARAAFASWLFADPYCVKAAKDAYLLAFFDAYLRNGPKTLLTQTPPYRGIDALKGRPHWSDGEERVPILVWMGLK